MSAFCKIYDVNTLYFSRGTAIAKIIGNNVMKSTQFDQTVNMYVYEETVNNQKLTDIINTQHENVKYLPGIKIPENIVSFCLYFFKTCITFYVLCEFFFYFGTWLC